MWGNLVNEVPLELALIGPSGLDGLLVLVVLVLGLGLLHLSGTLCHQALACLLVFCDFLFLLIVQNEVAHLIVLCDSGTVEMFELRFSVVRTHIQLQSLVACRW